MIVMVFDVPAEGGGALSILNDFYKEVTANDEKDIKWIFVVSKPILNETENVKVLSFPWIKKSWFHRLYFDNVVSPKLIKKHKADKVISFQNIVIPRVEIPQILYVHQPLPFIDYKFRFKDNKKFWVYQNVIGKKIINSIKKAEKVIVQTKWMKDACLNKSKVDDEKKILIIPPKIEIDDKRNFEPTSKSLSTFFYPAGANYYKNHRIIVDALKELKKMGVTDLNVIFTLKGNENKHIAYLYNEVKKNKLHIEFYGSIAREKVFEFYSKSVLLFPSYIETFGMPLSEAKMHECIIIASNCPFSHEILEGYSNSYFFDPYNVDQLVNLILKIKNKSIEYNKQKHSKFL